MTPTENASAAAQRTLRAAVAQRLRRARPELAARHDLSTPAGLAAAAAQAAEAAHDTVVAVVVRDLDLAAWARQTCAYTLGLGVEEAGAWRRSLTRTVFLAGNPEHLGARFPLVRLAPDGSAAWTVPGPPAATVALRRLLKLLQAPAQVPTGRDVSFEVPHPASYDAPGAVRPPVRPPVRRDLWLATADCTTAAALIHLNHLLAEAVLDGLIAPGDRLTLRRTPRLAPRQSDYAAVRAVPDDHDPRRLRLTAALTTPSVQDLSDLSDLSSGAGAAC
ncbi:DUF6182 family protein [Streptomyces sp. DSM 15324]|uniref:DUF6182 family protein n=1 Tax=Streptomyces sp. DSM 15324 TaxID=1739111 RepID=UPI00074A1FC8|nr:DUF6182 family protein [Streptomyces sp. DSM 15324]KUO13136.1 hypothetical protein AQJ58_04425 [Streptomyces sp. DSM 15324]